MDDELEQTNPRHSVLSTQLLPSRVAAALPGVRGGEAVRGVDDARHLPRVRLPVRAGAGVLDERRDAELHDDGRGRMLLVGPLAYSGLPVLAIIAIGLTLAALLPLLCFRHIKALWLAIDLRIRPPTTFERLSGYLHVMRRGGL